MKKKKYQKPNVISNRTTGLVPALAVGAALAGGYAIGRVVKQAIEVRDDGFKLRSLNKVVTA